MKTKKYWNWYFTPGKPMHRLKFPYFRIVNKKNVFDNNYFKVITPFFVIGAVQEIVKRNGIKVV